MTEQRYIYPCRIHERKKNANPKNQMCRTKQNGDKNTNPTNQMREHQNKFVYIFCRWRSNYQVRHEIPLTGLTQPHFCVYLKTDMGSNIICRGSFLYA